MDVYYVLSSVSRLIAKKPWIIKRFHVLCHIGHRPGRLADPVVGWLFSSQCPMHIRMYAGVYGFYRAPGMCVTSFTVP